MTRGLGGELKWQNGIIPFDDEIKIDKQNFTEAMQFLWDYRNFSLQEYEIRHYLSIIYLFFMQRNNF